MFFVLGVVPSELQASALHCEPLKFYRKVPVETPPSPLSCNRAVNGLFVTCIEAKAIGLKGASEMNR